MSEQPSVSVIIPVWNGQATIGKCLRAIEAQTYPAELTQVLVIDNGSTDDTTSIIRSFPGCMLLSETAPGSYAARNLGLRHASGDIIAFTDADCIPDPEWLERIVEALAQKPRAGVIAGRISTFTDGPMTDAAIFDSLFAFRQQTLASRNQCVTANWASPAAVLKEVGPFDAELKSGGDWALAEEIAAAGYPVVYCEKAHVRHPARSSTNELIGKRKRVAGGNWHKQAGPAGFIRLQRRAAVDLLRKWGAIWAAPGVQLRRKLPVSLLALKIWAAYSGELVRLAMGGSAQRS